MKKTEKIDELFKTENLPKPQNLKTFTANSTILLPQLEEIIKSATNTNKRIEKDLTRVYNLSAQIRNLKLKSDGLDKILSKKTQLYEMLKALIVSLDLKQKDIDVLNSKPIKLENINLFEESLSKIYVLDSEIKIKAVEERNLLVNKTLKNYRQRIENFFEFEIEKITKNEKFELKIQKNVHKIFTDFKAILEFETLKFYKVEIEKIYEKDFKENFQNLLQKFKTSKKNFNEELIETLKINFEMIKTIFEEEVCFVYSVFYDGTSNKDEIVEIFTPALKSFFVFLEKIFKFDKISTFFFIFSILKEKEIFSFDYFSNSSININNMNNININNSNINNKSDSNININNINNNIEKKLVNLNLIKEKPKKNFSSQKKTQQISSTLEFLSDQLYFQLLTSFKGFTDDFYNYLRQILKLKDLNFCFDYLKTFLVESQKFELEKFSSKEFEFKKLNNEIFEVYEKKIRNIETRNISMNKTLNYIEMLAKIYKTKFSESLTTKRFLKNLVLEFQKKIFESLVEKDFQALKKCYRNCKNSDSSIRSEVVEIVEDVLKENLSDGECERIFN